MPHDEAQCIAAELDPPFTIVGVESQRTPILFNSPHSGRIYPSVFIKSSRLSAQALRKSEDAYVDELLSSAPSQGAALMQAHFPRAYIDINREPYELDPVLFNGRLPDFVNSQSLRAIGGLGTIARIVNDKEEIYHGPLTLETAFIRIEKLYKPYHAALKQLMEQTKARFGPPSCSIVIPCPRSTRIEAAGRISSWATASALLALRRSQTSSRRSLKASATACPEQALCRGVHHRALRQAEPGLPRAADRGGSQPLYE